jgi:Protein of unknown function (DUF3800)
MSDAPSQAVGSKRPLLHLYIDETGPRHPDRSAALSNHGFDWFAIGGILIRAEDEDRAKLRLTNFTQRWPQIKAPLHLTDMRSEKKKFAWLGKLSVLDRERFWSGYRTFLANLPVAGTACVIDRPGYVARGYGKREGDTKWLLCRSAFDIVVERAAKLAKHQGRRLKIFYEMADPSTNKMIEAYFYNIKANGMGFDAKTSAKYLPLTPAEFEHLLLDMEGKDKTNRMMQIADSYVYSIARGSYQRKFVIYRRLAESGRLVTSQVPPELAPILGVKTYCFELVTASKTAKAGFDPDL